MKLFCLNFFKTCCLLAIFACTAHAQNATPAPTLPRAGTSDSGAMKNRLRFRIERALGTEGTQLGMFNGYHWIFLVQVARYRDSNVRFTDQRRGLQAFLDELVQARRAWPPATVEDTVSIIPYHFNILGSAGERQKPLRDFLTDTTALKQRVPGQPQDDKYGDGQMYRDGHDWRHAMTQTLDWMKKEDIPVQNSILVVLDWNDLAQAPQQSASGTNAVGPSKYLVMPQNAELWKQFTGTMQDNGLEPKNLETVQVGNLEYDMAVFTAEDARPIKRQLTPPLIVPAAQTRDKATPVETKNSGGGGAWLLLLPLLAIGAFVASKGFAAHGVKLNDKSFGMRAFGPTATLEILGANGKARSGQLSYVLPESAAPTTPTGALAMVKVNLMGKIQVSSGAYQVKSSRGFKAMTNNSIEMTLPNGAFELRDGSDQLVTIIEVKRT